MTKSTIEKELEAVESKYRMFTKFGVLSAIQTARKEFEKETLERFAHKYCRDMAMEIFDKHFGIGRKQ